MNLYSNVANHACLKAFLRPTGLRFVSFASFCDETDDELFSQIINNFQHLLRLNLPLLRIWHNYLRNIQLPARSSTLQGPQFHNDSIKQGHRVGLRLT